jgi:hypothetical protein
MGEMTDPGGPLWWVKRLTDRMAARREALERNEAYYSGKHRMAFATSKFREAFGNLFREFADNWCSLVVDACEERLNVEGFRLGDDNTGDDLAWRIWQENQLDAESQQAHLEALIHLTSYALVTPGQTEGELPLITIEHPLQAIVAVDPSNRRRRLAGLKIWTDDEGFELVTLYLPDEIYKFRSRAKRPAIQFDTGRSTLILPDGTPVETAPEWRWEPREIEDEVWPLPNPFGEVPLVPLVNRPRLLAEGVSELAPIIPIQDGINKLVADLLVASEFGAFRQRWATGIEIPTDPITGRPSKAFEAAINRLWTASDKDVKWGEFGETNLPNIVAAIEMLVQHAASQTRTPPHYFYLRGQFPSGESIKSAETGLVAKVRRKTRSFGEGHEEVMRLSFIAMGRTVRRSDIETIWGDPESRSESEHVDAVMKRRALGVPLQQCWEDLGYTPAQIQRFKEMLTEEAAYVAALPQIGKAAEGAPIARGPHPASDAGIGSELEPAAAGG